VVVVSRVRKRGRRGCLLGSVGGDEVACWRERWVFQQYKWWYLS
jgi:hypothetical protein